MTEFMKFTCCDYSDCRVEMARHLDHATGNAEYNAECSAVRNRQNAAEHGYTAVGVARTMQRAVRALGTAVKVARNAATNKGANVTP